MGDLISRASLRNAMKREKITLANGLQYIRAEAVMAKIDMSPGVDAVAVVRCRECAYRGSDLCPMCYEEYYCDEDDGGDWVTRDVTVDDGFCHKGAKLDGGAADGSD